MRPSRTSRLRKLPSALPSPSHETATGRKCTARRTRRDMPSAPMRTQRLGLRGLWQWGLIHVGISSSGRLRPFHRTVNRQRQLTPSLQAVVSLIPRVKPFLLSFRNQKLEQRPLFGDIAICTIHLAAILRSCCASRRATLSTMSCRYMPERARASCASIKPNGTPVSYRSPLTSQQ
jgi:hypothetical protein